jgi:glycosyltransferase involved in cell wall biosynthesis
MRQSRQSAGRRSLSAEGLYLVIPAFNEEDAIRETVEQWYRVVAAHHANGLSRLVVVNDGSTDRTGEILKELALKKPLLTILTKKNGGHGSAVLYGYRYALYCGAEWIFQTDADGQTNPAEFEAFWKRRNSYAAMFGERTHRGDGADRAFVERVLCAILFAFFGVRIPDANAPFRLMHRRFLKQYLRKLPTGYSLPNVMLTVFGVYYRDRVVFLPVSFQPRQGGKQSMNLKRIVRIGIRSLRDFAYFRRRLKDAANRDRTVF